MDIDITNRVDWENRRKMRLTQVRDQSKEIAKTIRNRVNSAVGMQLEQNEMARNKMEQKFKSLTLNKLKSDFNYLIQDIGNGYSVASTQPDPNIVMAEKRLINRCKALSRGTEAEKRQKQIQEKRQLEQEMRERKLHFNKTVEKIRSTLITNLQNVDNGNNHLLSVTKNNECILIPSQVTLNESNILDWKSNKNSKPWSMVINSKENNITNFPKLATNNENKENYQNVPKFKKLETEMKNYETLVVELNKLSIEEQNAGKKLFTRNKEILVPYENDSNFIKQDKGEQKVKNVLDKNTKLNQIKNHITEEILNKSDSSSSVYISSSASNNISYRQPVEPIRKYIHFENNIKKKNVTMSSSKLNCNSKSKTDKPLRNLDNMVNRITNKKQLLKREISGETKSDIKKTKLNLKTSKRCMAGNDSLWKESPINYAKLPDSFYNCQLKMLNEQFSNKNIKLNDYKNPKSINLDLIKYINMLLKMTPSDIDNLSISSCSSIKLEDSILYQSKQNENLQYYNEILNCISKCLNMDTSDISKDTMFDSPKNINLLNKLQELINSYSKKSHKIKNICDESLQVLNKQINVTNETEVKIIQENNSMSLSSDSSVDGEYVMKHLHTLLKKKGLIKSDKEWPMFENISDNDDNRSLTDQLLDIYPHRSDNN